MRIFFSKSRPSGPFNEISRMRTSGCAGGHDQHGSARIFRLAANYQVKFSLRHERQAAADDGMVIDHENSFLDEGVILHSAASVHSRSQKKRRRTPPAVGIRSVLPTS